MTDPPPVPPNFQESGGGSSSNSGPPSEGSKCLRRQLIRPLEPSYALSIMGQFE